MCHLLAADPDPARAGAGIILLWALAAVVGTVFYFLPTGIAILRGHPNLGPILVVNLFLGWLCVGWIVALAWCLSSGQGQRIEVYTDTPRRRKRPRDDWDDEEDD